MVKNWFLYFHISDNLIIFPPKKAHTIWIKKLIMAFVSFSFDSAHFIHKPQNTGLTLSVNRPLVISYATNLTLFFFLLVSVSTVHRWCDCDKKKYDAIRSNMWSLATVNTARSFDDLMCHSHRMVRAHKVVNSFWFYLQLNFRVCFTSNVRFFLFFLLFICGSSFFLRRKSDDLLRV